MHYQHETMQKTGGSVLKRSRIFKSGINRRAMKAARESIALPTEEKQRKADYSSNYLIRKIFVGKHNQKSQSAMEYLMTYGWAILIIAVVLGALYSLGVFNANNFAPKAPPGSCQVFRPNGPGTSFDLNLEGVCNGELPEYVASFRGNADNDGSNISIQNMPALASSSGNGVTVTLWVDPKNTSNFGGLAIAGQNLQIGWATEFTVTASGWISAPSLAPANTWTFLAGTDTNGGNIYFYMNNDPPVAGTNTASILPGEWIFGAYYPTGCNPCAFNGMMANIQIYNTSLSASEIQALYQEGIGGAPIDLQNLVGWWPLNGNANDYSGNGHNGVPSNVMFVSNWWSGYTPP
ncbi:MAG: LamG-like jellyroll fold domain-containing protein [Candidatus Micrarchaeaceae archaeon]